MYKNKELHLRGMISLVFAFVVLAPLILIVADLANVAKQLCQQKLAAARQEVKQELALFRESLIPRQFVENLIKAGEACVGLNPETMQRPVFARNQDAGVFTSATIAQLLEFYQRQTGIKPLVMVSFNTDYANVWSWFNEDYSALRTLTDSDRRRFTSLLPIFVADTATFTPVISSNPDAFANFNKLFAGALLGDRRDFATQKFFYDYLGDLAYRPPHYGRVYEMATTRLGSRRFFTYHLPVKEGEMVYGGYFVLFGSRNIATAKILELSRKGTRPGMKRFFTSADKFRNNQIVSHNSLSLSMPFPVELASYDRLSGSISQFPERIAVALSISDLRKTHDDYLSNLAVFCRFVSLTIFAVAVYFTLFGFPGGFRLRLRMIAIIALTIFLPWIILGYFCLSLFDSVQTLAGHELRAEAGSSMYRLISYYHDQKLQLNLELLKAKDRLLRYDDKAPEELEKLHAHNIVPPGSNFDLLYFRADGFARTFRAKHTENISVRRIDCYLAARYMDNLGVIDRGVPANRKYLEQGEYSAGFMDSLQINYSEHTNMFLEGVETREWKKADELSRMVYFLLPDPKLPGQPVRSVAKISISSPNFVMIRPGSFNPGVYSQRLPQQQHDFLIGQRRVDDSILRWWPDYINSSSELKRQVDLAASTRSGGSRLTQDGNGFRFVNRRYLKSQSLVFSGVSTAAQDLRVEMLLKLFPFVLLALALICLFLFADLLAAMFINPVAGFRSATAEIAGGNYQVAVKIAATDEFSSLADAFNRMATGLAQREKMRRFVSENLFERIGQSSSDNAGASEVTLLASDIRSFTTLSEKHEPQQIVSLLNDYFTEMECAIKESGGLIERFVGDAVVAVFYNDQTEKPEHRAVQAAVRMRARLAGLNRQRTAAGLFNFDNGIGIATGEAVSGIAGSSAGRQIFSVIGEVTGLAEKLESASRNVASRILICPKTAAGLADRTDLSEVTGQFGFAAFTIVADEVLNG
ncbi:MAG: hypothetical protein CVV41_14340 [Candidatus Riflebacteria bacterium HGW-Riflebacteria-1]|jgi:class 3 adenylate cyclase|nr:MAG: hypothetical protein CVV41_14340 [Candidatus Riflebacteria bacterium HGW-Riflebacteria-1]